MSLKKILDQLNKLPSLPQVFMRVSMLTKDPRTTADDIAVVIESDEAMRTKMLLLVNSPFFGRQRKINTVHQAVTQLGFNTVCNAILSVSVVNSYFQKGKNSHLDKYRLGIHSIGTGIIARFIENELKIGREEEAFTAGILHDLGKLVLIMDSCDGILKALKLAKQKRIPLFKAEKKVFGASHDEIGEYLAERWNLSYGLAESMAFHHTPFIIRSDPKLVSIIHLADILCHRLKIGSVSGGNFTPEIVPFALEELEINASTVKNWLSKMKITTKKAKDLLSLLY